MIPTAAGDRNRRVQTVNAPPRLRQITVVAAGVRIGIEGGQVLRIAFGSTRELAEVLFTRLTFDAPFGALAFTTDTHPIVATVALRITTVNSGHRRVDCAERQFTPQHDRLGVQAHVFRREEGSL